MKPQTDPTPAVFDDSVSFDDPKPPFAGWQPNPRQIAAWCQVILAGLTADERLRRLRSDLRPMVRTSDDRLVPVTADDYDRHQERNER